MEKSPKPPLLTVTAEKISAYWSKNGVIDPEEAPWYTYGLEILFSCISNFLVITGCALATQSVLNAFIFLLIFIPLREFIGGYHADTYFKCNFYLALTYLVNFFTGYFLPDISFYVLFPFIAVGGFLVIRKLSPVDCPNKRCSQEQKLRNRRKGYIVFAIDLALAISAVFFNIAYSITILLTLLEIFILLLIGYFKFRET